MKFTKMTLLCTATILTALGVATTTHAATTTDGKVNFSEGTGPVGDEMTLIKPGTKDEIIIMDKDSGNDSKGGIRFSFLPNLDFGAAKISILEEKYHAKPVSYTKEGDATKKYIAPFVQVINESGTNAKYKVTVSATKFKSGSDHVLNNSQIKLLNMSGRNNTLDVNNDDVDAIAGGVLSVPNNGAVTIPTTGTATELFSSADGEKTVGNASSMVFEKDYSNKKVVSNTDTMKSVELTVPATDTPKNEAYSSTITWNLENTN